MSLFSDLWTQRGCKVAFVGTVDGADYIGFSGKPIAIFTIDDEYGLTLFDEFIHEDGDTYHAETLIREHIEMVNEEMHG